MRVSESTASSKRVLALVASIALLVLAAPRSGQAATLVIEESVSKVFVAGQVETYEPAQNWNIDIVGMTWVFSNIYFPDVSANTGFGEFYRFVVMEPVSAPAPGANGHVTTNTFDVQLQFWDPLVNPNAPSSTAMFEIFLTTLGIPNLACGAGSDTGTYGRPKDSAGKLRLEGIACVPSLPGVFNDQFVNFEIAATLVPVLPLEGTALLVGLLLAALGVAQRRSRTPPAA